MRTIHIAIRITLTWFTSLRNTGKLKATSWVVHELSAFRRVTLVGHGHSLHKTRTESGYVRQNKRTRILDVTDTIVRTIDVLELPLCGSYLVKTYS